MSCKGIKLRVFIKEELVVFHWLTFRIIYIHKYYLLHIYIYKLYCHFQFAVWPNRKSKKALSHFHRTFRTALNPFSTVKLLNFAIAFRKKLRQDLQGVIKTPYLRYWNLKAHHYTGKIVMWRKQEDKIQSSRLICI